MWDCRLEVWVRAEGGPKDGVALGPKEGVALGPKEGVADDLEIRP